MTTGPLHWELLAKARAVDNQLYVLTCSPARNPDSSYQVRRTVGNRPRGGRSCVNACGCLSRHVQWTLTPACRHANSSV